MSIRILTEQDPQGGHLGPFARLWAREAETVVAFAPGSRTSRDIAGRITLEVMPSGVFYPTVDNVIASAQVDPFLLENDRILLQTKGFGPIKLRHWQDLNPVRVEPRPDDLPFDPQKEVLLEGFPEESYYAMAEEICLVACAGDIPGDPRATCLALYDVDGDLPDTPLPIVMYTKKGAPLKVILHEV